MNQPVPPDLSPVIRHAFATTELPYRAWGAAERVYADMRVVPWAQALALERYRDCAEWPTVEQAVDLLIVERAATLDRATHAARRQFRDEPEDVRLRAAKLICDGWAELDGCSQVVELTGSALVLNDRNDVERKVDAILYLPRSWGATSPVARLAFSRRDVGQLDARELARRWESMATWEIRVPLRACEWVGEVACYPRDRVAASLLQLRESLPLQQSLPLGADR